MIKIILLVLFILITIWCVFLYIDYDFFIKNELKRANIIEMKIKKEIDELNYHRFNSIPCDINELNNNISPKDCFELSGHKCRYDEKSKRCNKI